MTLNTWLDNTLMLGIILTNKKNQNNDEKNVSLKVSTCCSNHHAKAMKLNKIQTDQNFTMSDKKKKKI